MTSSPCSSCEHIDQVYTGYDTSQLRGSSETASQKIDFWESRARTSGRWGAAAERGGDYGDRRSGLMLLFIVDMGWRTLQITVRKQCHITGVVLTHWDTHVALYSSPLFRAQTHPPVHQPCSLAPTYIYRRASSAYLKPNSAMPLWKWVALLSSMQSLGGMVYAVAKSRVRHGYVDHGGSGAAPAASPSASGFTNMFSQGSPLSVVFILQRPMPKVPPTRCLPLIITGLLHFPGYLP